MKKIGAIIITAILMTACPNPFLHDDGTVPDKPAELASNANVSSTATSITISWPAVKNASGYHIYRSTSLTGPYTKIDSSKTPSYTDKDISSGTTYYYKIAAYNDTGTGSQSDAISTVSVPAAPTVSQSGATTTSITISWAPVTGATGYYIYRSSSSTGTYTLLTTGTLGPNATSYTDNGLTIGTTYYYKVAAYNGGGTGSQSIYITAETIPGVPTGLKTMSASSTSITISWSAVTGASSYFIYRSGTLAGTYTQVGTSTTTSYTDTGVTASANYYYKVAARNSGGTGSQSDASLLQNNGSAPSAPTGLMTTAATSSTVTLTWNAIPGVTGYYVYRSSSSTGTFTQVGNPTSATYTDTGLSLGTTYYYKVAAYNSSGTGLQSSVYAATQYSSTNTISITGTAKAGQTITVTTTGDGWSSTSYSWGYADSGDASRFTFLSGYTSSSFTIPSSGYVGSVNLVGKYIRAFRRHPNGSWEETLNNEFVAKIYPSNFLGPVQP